jgi:hypothetical protein
LWQVGEPKHDDESAHNPVMPDFEQHA